jgi:hypothetical protein
MLQAPVGPAQANHPDDVRLVQTLLNDRHPAPAPHLAIDGICGPLTIAAIKTFERDHLADPAPTGRVAPGSATLRALAPVTPTEPPSIPKAPLPAAVIAGAQAAQAAWGVPASISLAQWILESGRGAHMPLCSNNPFGIKATGAEPCVLARTREVIDGQDITLTARFRKFASIAEAFDCHARLLATFPPYRAAMAHAADPDAFADCLTGVYATDPNYGAALKTIMRGGNLHEYDTTKCPSGK